MFFYFLDFSSCQTTVHCINKLYSRKRPLQRNLLQSLSLSPILHPFRVSKQAMISLQGMALSKKACGHCRLSRYQMALGSTHPLLSFLTIFPFLRVSLLFNHLDWGNTRWELLPLTHMRGLEHWPYFLFYLVIIVGDRAPGSAHPYISKWSTVGGSCSNRTIIWFFTVFGHRLFFGLSPHIYHGA